MHDANADIHKDEKEEYPLERQDYADKIPNEVENIVGGAIMRGDLDNTHPIGFGYLEMLLMHYRIRRMHYHRILDKPVAQ